MKLKEVGERIRLHPKTVAKKIGAGKLKATMTPRANGRPYWNITEENLTEYLKQYE